MKHYKLDTVQQDTVDCVLYHYASEFFRTIGMPGVTIAYRVDVEKAYHPRTITARLTFEEEPTSELTLPFALYNSIKALKDEGELGPDDLRFQMKRISFTELGGHLRITPGAILALLGASPDYGKNDQSDIVDARYSVDEWGNSLLISGLLEGKKPFSIISNYNFNGLVPDLSWGRLDFENYLPELEQIAKKEKS